MTLTGTVDVGQGGNTITNTTTAASGLQPDPSTAGDDLTESVTVENDANLVTVKTLASGNSTPEEGDTVSFQIVVTNNGSAQATGVTLTDTLPPGITFSSASVSAGTSYNSGNGLFNIGTLGAGSSATLTLTGTVDVGEGGNTITNTTTAAMGDQNDPSTAGDDLTEAVTVENDADLVTVKTLASGDSIPDEGDTVSFQIVVTNNGAAQATNVSLTDTLPAGITFVSSSVTTGSYNSGNGLFTIGTLNAGSSATLTLTGTVDIGEGGNTITNITTAATGDQNDPSTAGDDLDESVEVFLVDKDWDGIPDSIDLDVDNDGILNADEISFEFVDVSSLGFPPGTVGANGSTDISSLYGLSAGSVILNYTNLNTHTAGSLTVSSTQPTQFTITGTEATQIRVAHGTNLASGGSDGINSLDGAIYNFTGTLENGYTQNNSGASYEIVAGAAADGNNSGGLIWESVGTATSVEVVTTNTPALNNNYRLIIGVPVPDTDGDGVHNECDFDSDNDGISDLRESGNADAIAADTNMDGHISIAEATAAGFTDTNGDGAWDQLGTTPVDSDGDGIADFLDLDSDNDGIPDAVEAQPTAGYQTPSIGVDSDGDGVVDTFDNGTGDHGGNFTTPEDTDGDGTPDYLDTDSDNDGIDDTTESGLMPGADTDGDGIADNVAPNSYGDTDGVITNTGSDLDDDDNNTSDVDFRSVSIDADLVTVKTLLSGDSTPNEGETVSFQIVVTNNGAGQATNVSLTDSLPPGITFTGSSVSTGAYNATTGLFAIGTLNAGSSATLTLMGTVDVGQSGNTITNITTAAMGDQNDPSTVGDDLVEAVEVENDADLVTVKTLASGSSSTPDEGDTVSFQIVVTNNGAAQATNVTLTDTLPTGLTFTGSSVTTGSYNSGTGLFTIGTLASGSSATLTLTGTVDVGQSGNTITNITTAAMGDQNDPSTVGDDLDETVEVENDADLVTVKTLASGDPTPAEGDTVTFQIVVTNNGAAQATNVSLTDQLPAGITYTTNTTTQGSFNPATGLWNIGTLNDGATATITISGTVDIGQGGNTITNLTTAATGDQTDPTTAGDDLEETVDVDNDSNLITVKTLASGDSTPAEGDTVIFEIEVRNGGSAQATNVSLVDNLPAGITFVSSSVTQGSYNSTTGLFTIGTVNAGDTATLTLVGTVDVGQGGNTITNTTTAASGDQPDPSTAGDELDESVEVDDEADLVTVKTLASGDNTPAEGDTVSFEIEVTNNGTAQATNVSLIDTLPAGITFVSSSVTQGTYNSTTGLFTIGTLNAGGTATLTLNGTVDVGQGGNTITNTTTAATGDQPDPSTAGDDLDEAVAVESDADLVTVKTLDSGDSTPAEGDTCLLYTSPSPRDRG